MAWYLAPSLAVLRSEVNTRWPNRDHTSDGTIGDEDHQAGNSDHNPNSREAVDAWDMDNDGVDVDAVIAAFQRHPSAHYWIWNRQIADRDEGWRRRAYTGPSPHTEHVHFSIRQSQAAEQDRRAWGLLEDIVTPAEFVKILDDPQVAARMRALPWQYKGGGIPADLSTLGVLEGIRRILTGLSADMTARLDAILDAALDDGDVTVQLGPEALAEMQAIRTAVAELPSEMAIRDVVADFGEGGAAALRAGQA